MHIVKLNIYIIVILFAIQACANDNPEIKIIRSNQLKLLTGAEQIDKYLPKITGKKIGLLVNQTSRVGNIHLLDTLLSLDVSVMKIFAPEHGFRGDADAGAVIKDGKDQKTGISVISLYGAKKKPGPTDFKDIDLIVFDLQDVGVRFYTYISTLHYVLEACAEQGIPIIILDRPNPNGHYIDGPMLDPAFSSFVGMHPVPVVHGMTMGEYASMIRGESWINSAFDLQMEIIPCEGYTHQTMYDLPVKPSPNLPNLRSILLYPSLCFFEGTEISVGRGTNKQFQIIGHPSLQSIMKDSFQVTSMPGAANPPHKDMICHGIDYSLTNVQNLYEQSRLDLEPLLTMYQAMGAKAAFFLPNNFFDKLAGSDQLRKQILKGMSEKDIRSTWKEGLDQFRKMREKYLLYPDL